MILRFKTKRDINGHCKYLAIDVTNNTWSNQCSRIMLPDEAIILTSKDYNSLRASLEENTEYTRIQYLD